VHARAHTHTHTHARVHARAHTHTYTHACMRSLCTTMAHTSSCQSISGLGGACSAGSSRLQDSGGGASGRGDCLGKQDVGPSSDAEGGQTQQLGQQQQLKQVQRGSAEPEPALESFKESLMGRVGLALAKVGGVCGKGWRVRHAGWAGSGGVCTLQQGQDKVMPRGSRVLAGQDQERGCPSKLEGVLGRQGRRGCKPRVLRAKAKPSRALVEACKAGLEG